VFEVDAMTSEQETLGTNPADTAPSSSALEDREALDVAMDASQSGDSASAATIMALHHELAQTRAELQRLKSLLPTENTSPRVRQGRSNESQQGGGKARKHMSSIGKGLGALLHLNEEIVPLASMNKARSTKPNEQILPERRAESESIPGPPEPSRAAHLYSPRYSANHRRSNHSEGSVGGRSLVKMMKASVGHGPGAVLPAALEALAGMHDSMRSEASFSTSDEEDREDNKAKEKKPNTASFVPLVARHACTASLGMWTPPSEDSSGNNKESSKDAEKRLLLLSAFSDRVQDVLNKTYHLEESPDRSDTSKFVVLPAGTGLALCFLSPAPGHPSVEHTAMYVAGCLLAWSAHDVQGSALRCGLAGGVLETVRDIYDLPNLNGPSIDLAARIMDCAAPYQILASSTTFVDALKEDAPGRETGLSYHVDHDRHEVIVDHDRTALVQSVTGAVTTVVAAQDQQDNDFDEDGARACSSFRPFGTDAIPEKKWYLRLKPTELSYDERTGAKGKVPPTELLRRHRRVAFVGVTHDRLSHVFQKVLDAEPDHKWDRIYLLFLSDARLGWVAEEMNETVDDLVASKVNARTELENVLKGRVRELHFLEYDRPFYCASYWDWDERGGFVHVSPLVWGANPKVCPAMNYHWIGEDPGNDYVAYQDGLTSLLQTATSIGVDGKPNNKDGKDTFNPSVLAMLAKLEKRQNHQRATAA